MIPKEEQRLINTPHQPGHHQNHCVVVDLPEQRDLGGVFAVLVQVHVDLAVEHRVDEDGDP